MKNPATTIRVLLSAVLTCILAGVKPSEAAGNAELRVLSLNCGEIGLVVDGVELIHSLGEFTFSQYYFLSAGEHTLNVEPNFSWTVTLKHGRRYTLAVHAGYGPCNARLAEAPHRISNSHASVRLVNLITSEPDSSRITLMNRRGRALLRGVEFAGQDAITYLPAPDVYYFCVQGIYNESHTPVCVPKALLKTGRSYTIWAVSDQVLMAED